MRRLLVMCGVWWIESNSERKASDSLQDANSFAMSGVARRRQPKSMAKRGICGSVYASECSVCFLGGGRHLHLLRRILRGANEPFSRVFFV